MAKSAEALSLLLKCGESLKLSDDALNDLKTYVMRYVYGNVRSSSLDLLRAEKWRCQKKKSLMRLPPDDDYLKQHITRAHFLAYVYSDILSLEVTHLPSAMAGRWCMVAVDPCGTPNKLFHLNCTPHRLCRLAMVHQETSPSLEVSDLPHSESDLSD